MKILSSVAGVVLLSAAIVTAQTNVTGKWILEVQTDAGSGTPTLTLKQDGEKLTGHYTGQLGDTDVTGTIKGNAFTFSFSADLQGQQFAVTYKGTAEKDTMKGTLDMGGMASGTFTGKKQ